MLRAKHAELEDKLDEESGRPYPNQDDIKRIKLAKLRIKDELATLQPS